MNLILEFVKQNPDQVNAFSAICALVVSFLSIILTVVSLLLQRRHNFKSLTPIASVIFDDYEDMVALKLKNTGVGPLIVEKFIATDGVEKKDNLISWMPNTPAGILWDNFYVYLDGIVVPPGEEVDILKLRGNINKESFNIFRDDVRKALSRLTVIIEYRDIYNRRMKGNQRNLQWFGRHFNK